MKKDLRKRLILTATLCGLLALFITLPTSFGYGTSFASATEVQNGTTNESLLTTSYVYYKICCSYGDSLSVTLTWYSGYDLDLRLYDPSRTSVDSSSSSGVDDVCTESTLVSGWYYIRVSYYSGSIPALITLIITGATGINCPTPIPGFELISTLVGLIAATFLAVILLKSRKKILY